MLGMIMVIRKKWPCAYLWGVSYGQRGSILVSFRNQLLLHDFGSKSHLYPMEMAEKKGRDLKLIRLTQCVVFRQQVSSSSQTNQKLSWVDLESDHLWWSLLVPELNGIRECQWLLRAEAVWTGNDCEERQPPLQTWICPNPKEEVVRGHNIVADGWAGAANPHSHPTPYPAPFLTQTHTQKASKTLVFPLFDSCSWTNGQTDWPTEHW